MKSSILTLEELGVNKYKVTKPIRLITLFSGYDSQSLALNYLGANYKHYKTCEWAVKSIQALKDLHFTDDNTDYSKELTKEQLVEYLTNKGISADYNKPMTYEQIKRLGEDKLRTIYNNIKATHNLVNIQQVKGNDLEIIDTDKYEYIMTYSFPCQSLSLAGKQHGMTKGSGTRSGMLWEVERILDEIKESNGELPQVLVMENVPQVHGSKNMADFQMWIDKLTELGYTSKWQDLNGKNFGIPQNRKRTFMVSILGDYNYEFPTEMPLKLRLKDILEKQVDEKYYLSDKVVSKLAFNKDVQLDSPSGIDLCDTKSEFREISNTIKSRYDCGYEHFSPGPTGIAEPQLDILAKTKDGNNFNTIYSENGISPTLLARDYKDPVRVAELKQLGQMYPNSGNPQAGRIYDKDGLSPCLDTCQGGNREVKIVEDNYVGTFDYNKSETFMHGADRLKLDAEIANSVLTTHADGVCIQEPTICASRRRNLENPNSRKKGIPLEERFELGPDGLSNTLTTVQHDNYLVEPQCVQYDVDTIVKVRKYPVDIEKLQDTLRERKEILKLNNDTIAEKLNVPITNVEHWFRKDKYFSIPTPEIWYQLKELLEIETNEFDESITTFEEKISEFDMSNRAYDDNGISPTITTQGNSNIVETDNLKRQLCNKLIEENKVQEGDIIRHSYTNSRFDSFHIENSENHDCCATITTRSDCIGYVENQEQKPCPTLDTRCDCLGVVVNDKDDSIYSETEKQLFTEDGNIRRYLNSDIIDTFEEGQMATTSYPNGYGHGSRTHNESISLNTIDKPSVKQNLRIRKLTPKECGRLMAVKDEDFEKIAKNQSNASLYHLFGDSIICTCLMAIFSSLLGIDWKSKINFNEWWNI